MTNEYVADDPPVYEILFCYFSYAILLFFAYLNEFLQRFITEKEIDRTSYTTLYDNYYFRNFFIRRIKSMFCHPICSTPSAKVTILERSHKLTYSGRKIEAINLGSYNYLGYSENTGQITDSVENSIKIFGFGNACASNELGTQKIHRDLEIVLANFLKVEDSIIVGMGFATNSTCIPSLFSKGCLVISDQLNHASIILGCKISGAKISVFKHNDMNDLEKVLRRSILEGQPKSKRAWKKIIIIVEGIYSMEGTIVNLPELLRLKKKYKSYLYVDEAHSIGALGPNARGVCDYFGCDPKQIDLLMGTFSKSFAASGGYIAGSKHVISFLRRKLATNYYCSNMSPAIAQQITSVIQSLMESNKESDGLNRIRRLRENTMFFRQQLIKHGFHIYGNIDSPVIPIMVYNPCILKYLIAQLLEHGIATTGAAYPVTSIVGARMRICLSASHSRLMLETAINAINQIGNAIYINYSRNK